MNWSFLGRWESRVLSVLRIVSGFLFMQHGLQKILGIIPRPGGQPSAMPAFFSTGGISGWLELVGGALLVLGLFTRPTAFILSGLMAVAYFYAHAPGGFWPILNRGELAALYSFVFLYLVFAGGGAWSVDNLLRRGKGRMS